MAKGEQQINGGSPTAGFASMAPVDFSAVPLPPSGSPAAFSGPQWVVAFCDQLAAASGSEPDLGSMQERFQGNPTQPLKLLFKALSPTYQKSLDDRLGLRAELELFTIAQERDPQFFLEQMKLLAHRLEDEGKQEAAGALLQAVKTTASGFSGKQDFAAISAAAGQQLDAMIGKGASGPRFEYLLKHFAAEAADPVTLASFALGGLAFEATKLSVMSRLLANPTARLFTRGFGASLVASGLALAVETNVFVWTGRLGRGLSGSPQDWSLEALAKELAATGLTLFCLKGAGALSQQAFRRLHGIDALAVAPSRLAGLAGVSQAALHQGGTLAGILLAHRLEQELGLRAKVDGATALTDGLVTLLNFHVAGKLANAVLGPGYHALQAELNYRYQNLKPALPLLPPNGLVPWQRWATVTGTGSGFGSAPKFSDPLGERLAPMQSSSNDDGGEQNGGNRLLPGAGPSEKPEGAKAPTEAPASSRNPEQIAAEARQQVEIAEGLLKGLHKYLADFDARVQVYLNHLKQGRQDSKEMLNLGIEIQTFGYEFFEKWWEARKNRESLVLFTFLLSGQEKMREAVSQSRSQMAQFLDSSEGIAQNLQKILDHLKSGDVAQMEAALNAIHREAPKLTGRPIRITPFENDGPKLSLSDLKRMGAFSGILAKEAYRGSPEQTDLMHSQLKELLLLDHGSPRAQDDATMKDILTELDRSGLRTEDYYQSLVHLTFFEEEPGSHISVIPREALRWGTSYQDPMRGWLGVYLPTLMVVEGLKSEPFLRKARSLELFMSEDTRAATHAAAWWLEKAGMDAQAPREWLEQWLGDPKKNLAATRVLTRVKDLVERHFWDQDRANRRLGDGGDLAVLGHALAAFLRFPYQPDRALQALTEAPADVREDAMSLTGALLGAFNGREVFLDSRARPESPGRNLNEKIQQMFQSLSRELFINGAYGHLKSLEGGKSTSTNLRLLRPVSEDPVWQAFRNGLRERFTSAEMIGVDAVWQMGVFLTFASEQGLKSVEWPQVQTELKDCAQLLEVLVKEAKTYAQRGTRRLKEMGMGTNSLPEEWEGMREQQKRFEAAVTNLRRFIGIIDGILSRGGDPQLDEANESKLRELALEITDLLENTSANSFLKLRLDPSLIRSEDIAAGQAGSVLLKRSVRPPFYAPLFDARDDAATSVAMLQAFRELPVPVEPSFENLCELYLSVLGASYIRLPEHSFAAQIALSALVSTVLPAYLEANREHPERAYRELAEMPTAVGAEEREAFRAVAYLSLRLLQGANPGAALLNEMKEYFSASTLATPLEQLTIDEAGEIQLPREVIQRWEASKDSRASALLGIYAFLKSPMNMENAFKQVLSVSDPHQLAERVVGFLTGLHRSRQGGGSLTLGGAEVIPLEQARAARKGRKGNKSDRPPESSKMAEDDDWLRNIGNALSPESSRQGIRRFWSVWAEARGENITESDQATFDKKLGAVPSYFYQRLEYFAATNPLLARALLVRFQILPEASRLNQDPEVLAELKQRSREILPKEEYESLVKDAIASYALYAANYFPNTYRPLNAAELKEWHSKLGELPPIFLRGLAGESVFRQASVLMMLSRLGLSKLGEPKSSLPIE